MLKNEGWQCQENLSAIPGDKGKFSCTPKQDIGILTIVWLEGKGGKEQMQACLKELTKNQDMVCYTSRTNQFWQ